MLPGPQVTVDMVNNVLTDHSTGKTYPLQSIGDVSISALVLQFGPGWDGMWVGRRMLTARSAPSCSHVCLFPRHELPLHPFVLLASVGDKPAVCMCSVHMHVNLHVTPCLSDLPRVMLHWASHAGCVLLS